MSIQLAQEPGTALLEIELTGKLHKEDYKAFLPKLEALIKAGQKPRLLVIMHDFRGWTAGAIWEDIKFDLHHFRDIDRIAFVGDKSWEKGMSTFCKPFTSAKIQFFTPGEINQARDWLNQSA
jgi:SpoIIAA-like